jgi:hypothetical protein
MKTLCLILLAVSLGFTVAGCGGNSKETATTEPSTTTEPTATTATTTETPTVSATTTVPPVASTTPTTREQTINVRIQGGKPVGGILRARVKKGQRVLLVVRSNIADEVHVHGYDLMQDVAAGGTARIHFVASIPGVFEVELEARGLQIAQLTVR